MRKVIILFLIIIILTSCASDDLSENVIPVWCDGVLVAEFENVKYYTSVSFNENEVIMHFTEPSFLKDVSVKINGDSFAVAVDELSLEYNNSINSVLTEFYNATQIACKQPIVYSVQDDVLVSEFLSDGNQCRIILNKNDKKVILFEMTNCTYNINEEVT